MTAGPPSSITVTELEQVLNRAEPAALLVPPRILRRVIKQDRGLGGLGLQVPHRKSYVIGRDALLRITAAGELGLTPGRELPQTLLLFRRPEPQRLAALPRPEALRKFWRLLFHARVHVHLAGRVADGKLTAAGVHERVRRIGRTECNEARAVLRQENFLLQPDDPVSVYEEFAALYLELRYFARAQLPSYFPALTDFAAVERVLALDVDADELFAGTRLEGAADPDPLPVQQQETTEAPPAGPALPAFEPCPDEASYRRRMAQADRAAACGNLVRAGILRVRALAACPPGQTGATHARACGEMERLTARLHKALGFPPAEADDWRQALLALLEPAARGFWSSAARLLYDLQKVCVDHERDIYAVDLVEWVASWGRRPVKRLLPNQQQALMVKHLRRALHRMTAVRMPEPVRRRLVFLLLRAVQRGEERLRERLRPSVRQALDEVGLVPRNVAEEVARDKVIEELLDRVIEQNFLTMSDLRDAIARNRLKLPDLTAPDEPSPPTAAGGGTWLGALCRRTGQGLESVACGVREFFLGDRLIRANRQLSDRVDGVYRRGEVYLRWLQRLSSAAFGTRTGRFLTLYLALPFGSAFALLMMWDEVLGLFGHAGEGGPSPAAVGLLGLFFLALFHVGPFRRRLAAAVTAVWHGVRGVFYDLPAAVLDLPLVRRILQSRPYLLFYQFVCKPLPWAGLATSTSFLAHAPPAVALLTGAGVFLAAAGLINSRLGMHLEEICTDNLVRTWQLIHVDIVPGLVRLVIFLFKRLLEGVERLLYTVDEWLRFRTGDSRLSLYVKPVLGLAWFVCTYLIRVLINLFVEPTVNPIKHFPVVTVAAKLILPFSLTLVGLITAGLEPVVGRAVARTAAAAAIFLLPGLAGFLVWELKENWRLYRANQPPTLRPEVVGRHGETVLRLLRPGLHSGTLPKLYAKLRRGRGLAVRRQYEALHHTRERLRQFVERDLLAVLAGSRNWGATTLTVASIQLACQRIRIELACPAAGGGNVNVDLEEHGGYLVAGLAAPAFPGTWLARLTPRQVRVFKDALAGFYKLAGAGLVREQVEAALPAAELAALLDEPRPADLRVLKARELVFAETPIAWRDWVETWERDHEGKGHRPVLPPKVRLLPRWT